MASIISDLYDKMFTSEFAHLQCSCEDASMTFAVKKWSAEILSQTYFPDECHRVTIYDLDKLLESYIEESCDTFTLLVNGAAVKTIMAIKCLTAIEERADSFHKEFFFTSSMGERDTALDRMETLSFYDDSRSIAVVHCSYLSLDGRVVTKNKERMAITDMTGMKSLNVSPSGFSDPDAGTLISYMVQVGRRKARYRVLANPPEADPSFIFRNSFGCWETIYLTGAKQVTPSYTRSNAIIEGRNIMYDINETMSFKAQTGPLRPAMVPVALDLARSREIYLLDRDGKTGDRITVTDVDVKHTNEDNSIPDFTFTYRRADRRSAIISVNRPTRLFDSTFDNTYE